MNKLYLPLALATFSLVGSYTDAEKITLIQEKLTFIEQQKNVLRRINEENRLLYKQALDIARYVLKDDFSVTKQQLKTAIRKILATQEFLNYHNYGVMFKTTLIGKHNFKAKRIPAMRPGQDFATQINTILGSTVPVKILQQMEVLTLFESLLNRKVDEIEIDAIISRLEELERELTTHLSALEADITA